MELFWVMTENQGGDVQKPWRRKETEAVTSGLRKKKIGFQKVKLQEEEMETGCVSASRSEARMEFVGMHSNKAASETRNLLEVCFEICKGS
uniref:Uncharacterized protein n=1 Tax=Cucumis melo TaxID=3656 RepID=A0A9I9D9F5_CUCME